MKNMKLKFSTGSNPRTVYDELKPILILSRIFGFASFHVTGNRLKTSAFYSLLNLFYVSMILYHTLVGGENGKSQQVSRSPLSMLFYTTIGIFRNVYSMVCLVHFTIKTNLSIRVWTFVEEINSILRGIKFDADFGMRIKISNYLATFVFLFSFALFLLAYALTTEEPFTVGLSVTFFLPIFNDYLLIFYFSMMTTNLEKKCRFVNGIVQLEIDRYRGISRNQFRFGDRDRNYFLLLRKIRDLKMVHMKMYVAVRNLNELFGFHFLYIFIMYFCHGSLHCFTIIRQISQMTSRALLFESIYDMTMETVQITFAVYGSIILDKEVRRTVTLVHKFLTMTNEEDVNLVNELQSFSLQLVQCGVNFSALGFFSVDFTMLFQFVVAFFSNAVFFLQVDNMNNAKKN